MPRRSIGHGSLLILLGVAVAAAAPDEAVDRWVMAGGLLSGGAGLLLVHTLLRPGWRWRGMVEASTSALGFGLAGALTYLAIGWLPMVAFVLLALAVAAWAGLRRPAKSPAGQTPRRQGP